MGVKKLIPAVSRPVRTLSVTRLMYAQGFMKKITIAVDGYSSCGKSTMAKDLARAIGYVYIDSGAMYRAVALHCLRRGLITDGVVDEAQLAREVGSLQINFTVNPATGRPETWLNGENVEHEIRGMAVSAQVSRVAAIGFVRQAMVALQQAMGREKGIVMDGRDIGTTVFPDAELKVFVTASPEIRARRRYDELKAKGQDVSYADILANVRQRDEFDLHREVSPLRRAADAVVLDNSSLTIDGQREWLLAQYHRVVGE